jgi:hypothetical protein
MHHLCDALVSIHVDTGVLIVLFYVAARGKVNIRWRHALDVEVKN